MQQCYNIIPMQCLYVNYYDVPPSFTYSGDIRDTPFPTEHVHACDKQP